MKKVEIGLTEEQQKDLFLRQLRGEITFEQLLSYFPSQTTMNRLRDKLGLQPTKYIMTALGLYHKDSDLDFWKNLFDTEYDTPTGTLKDLAIKLNIHPNTLKDQFIRCGFVLKSDEVIDKVRKQRVKDNSLEKTGYVHPSMRPEVRKKMSENWNSETMIKGNQTRIEKYGVDNLFKLPEVQAKIQQDSLEKHGSKSPGRSPEAIESRKKTNLELYGVENALFQQDKLEAYRQKQKELYMVSLVLKLQELDYELIEPYVGLYEPYPTLKRYQLKHLKCGTTFTDDLVGLPRCTSCYHSSSSQEQEFYRDFILKQGFQVISTRDKVLSLDTNRYLELDLYIEQLNLAFEFNGLYWHRKRYESYHQNKSDSALTLGISVYHIWGQQDIFLVKSMIKSVLGKTENKISARETEFKEVPYKEAVDFLEYNHIQGFTISSMNFGLYYQGRLLQLITYRPYPSDNVIEIVRSATLRDHVVQDGFSKLLKNSIPFLKKQGYNRIFTYADRDWSPKHDETDYFKCGFTFLGTTPPSLFYTDFNKSWSWQELHNRKKLAAKYPEAYDDNLTIKEILQIKKIYPCYTSGNWKYELNI